MRLLKLGKYWINMELVTSIAETTEKTTLPQERGAAPKFAEVKIVIIRFDHNNSLTLSGKNRERFLAHLGEQGIRDLDEENS